MQNLDPMLIGIYDDSFLISQEADYKFDYEPELTTRLDSFKEPFDQNTINEIALWKVGRFASVNNSILRLINSLDPFSENIDLSVTAEVLKCLLKTKGIGLPMASTILRFRNPNIYQIIDQRVYRVIYPNKTFSLTKTGYNHNSLISIYLEYLADLKDCCQHLNIPFKIADRVLFMADKRINKSIPIKY